MKKPELQKVEVFDCPHQWSYWTTLQNKSVGYTFWLLIQERVCFTCKMRQVKKDTL